jgi:hypothetical protein
MSNKPKIKFFEISSHCAILTFNDPICLLLLCIMLNMWTIKIQDLFQESSSRVSIPVEISLLSRQSFAKCIMCSACELLIELYTLCDLAIVAGIQLMATKLSCGFHLLLVFKYSHSS